MRVTQEQKDKNLEIVGKQLRKIPPFVGNIKITCPCSNRIKIYYAYKCFFCKIWFCESCAKEHFKKGGSDV